MNRRERSKIKLDITNLKVQTRRRKKKKMDKKWIIQIIVISFSISLCMSLISEVALTKVPLYIGIILVILFILVGILFDMIGVAVTASSEKVFHSMNSRKVKGADIAVLFKKNADKVASFCNDVVGDICGVISGSAGITIALSLAHAFHVNALLVSLLVTSFIAALTIGGKALGKGIAMNKSNIILFRFSLLVSCIYKKRKR